MHLLLAETESVANEAEYLIDDPTKESNDWFVPYWTLCITIYTGYLAAHLGSAKNNRHGRYDEILRATHLFSSGEIGLG